MATAFRSGTLGLIQHLFDMGTCTGLSDARLLERFVTDRDEAAFATLVARHGALVLTPARPCCRTRTPPMTPFRPRSCCCSARRGRFAATMRWAAWLHRVAYRTALQARSDAARRRNVEKVAGDLRAHQDPGPGRPHRGAARGNRAAPRSASPAGGPLLPRRDDPGRGRRSPATAPRARCAAGWPRAASCSSAG